MRKLHSRRLSIPQLNAFGVSETESINTAASHLGIAQGLTTLLRAVPYSVETENRVPLARWILAKNNCLGDDIFLDSVTDHNKFPIEGKNAIFEFASVAQNHLRSAKDVMTNQNGNYGPLVDQKVYPAFLPAMLVQEYLDCLEEADFNVFDPGKTGEAWMAYTENVLENLSAKQEWKASASIIYHIYIRYIIYIF